jgi:hypothetical protein
VTATASSHGDNPNTRPGQRRPTAPAAATIAATASTTTDPAGSSTGGSGSSSHSSVVNAARSGPARAANRRSQPRTVAAGRPSPAAICRCPHPAALAARAAPITTAASARLTRTLTGSSTCVRPHPAHRARRGRSRHPTTPCSRSTRGRAYPHGPSRCPHPGHASRPWASRRSTAAPSLPTVSTGASKHRVRPSRRLDQKRPGGPTPIPDALTLSSHTNKGNPTGLPQRLLIPDDAALPLPAHLK